MDREAPVKGNGPPSLACEEAEADEIRGWDAIAEWTGGVDPSTVDELCEMRAIEPLSLLLHAHVGRSLRDFLVREAAL